MGTNFYPWVRVRVRISTRSLFIDGRIIALPDPNPTRYHPYWRPVLSTSKETEAHKRRNMLRASSPAHFPSSQKRLDQTWIFFLRRSSKKNPSVTKSNDPIPEAAGRMARREPVAYVACSAFRSRAHRQPRGPRRCCCRPPASHARGTTARLSAPYTNMRARDIR
jgi:hypothetical protein